ncbi:hypothetical protein NDU88_007673 [Pleurodeles waltl]|uniref:Uncharacterized protein n=1 Tax=Pleurodeles waltl TaxID=8319 RepID=A0AAV7ST69_PLEWA|nr:hypothetical protein NDU88_007673 [Pleurodeles waltl]
MCPLRGAVPDSEIDKTAGAHAHSCAHAHITEPTRFRRGAAKGRTPRHSSGTDDAGLLSFKAIEPKELFFLVAALKSGFPADLAASEDLERGDGLGMDDILHKCEIIFKDRLGEAKGYVHKILLKKGAIPVRHMTGRIPIAIRGDVKDISEHMVAEGVIEPLEAAEWLTPVVITKKLD